MTAERPHRRAVIDSATHFLGQSPSDPHFGLGRYKGAIEVRVRWPTTGRVSVVKTNALDRMLTIVEPNGGKG